MKSILYRLYRFVVGLIARPSLTGADNLALDDPDAQIVYVLHHRSLTDLLVLDLVCEAEGHISPREPLNLEDFHEERRFFCLFRAAASGRITMQTHSERLQRLVSAPDAAKSAIVLIPVSVFWGRSMSGDSSLFRLMTSEHWSVTGRFKRFVNLIINRRNILVHTGRPVALTEVAPPDTPNEIAVRRAARYLRVRLRQQKVTTLGPDFSHRRTLLSQVVGSRQVQDAIARQVEQGEKLTKVERRARKYARTIASDMSNPTIRILARLLRWFWNRIYDGLQVRGLEQLEEVSGTHTLVYVPSHRSHFDYLLLSYLLYDRGYMIPHIAAGDNLNLPIVGGILRRGGAFFMRRSFRGDVLYTSVFNEYLYQVYRRGHCVEFFPEGGRTRTGRLLPAKLGLLKMSLDHQERGLPKPLAFIPVYFGYEKLVEGSSYLSELRGADKKQESVMDLVRNLKLIKQNFGSVDINLGTPILIDQWLKESTGTASDGSADVAKALGDEILIRINQHASLNPVNLVALVTLTMPKLSIEESQLVDQIACYQNLLTHLYHDSAICTSGLAPTKIISHVEELGLLERDEDALEDVLTHDPFTAVLMTWYKNNIAHTLALPSLVACLLAQRDHPIGFDALATMVRRVYPYLAQELSAPMQTDDLYRCVKVMHAMGLIELTGELYTAPDRASVQYRRLQMLGQLVSSTLERMFIVIHLLVSHPTSRDDLRVSSQRLAARMSRIYGINSPEFSDQRLFDQFIDELIRAEVVLPDADGILGYTQVLTDVLSDAQYVIDAQIRQGVLSANSAS